MGKQMADLSPAMDRAVTWTKEFLARPTQWGALVAPMLVLVFIFFVIPILYLIRMSFAEQAFAKSVVPIFGVYSLENYAEIFGDIFFLEMIVNSLIVGTGTVVATLLISYPIAYYLTLTRGWERTLILVACLLPLFVNIMVAVLGWYILLLPFGVIQNMLSALGLIEGPLGALKSSWTLIMVLTYEHIPFAILILAASLQNVARDKINMARVLGAGVYRIFLTIVLPLTMPGVVATAILVFALSISSYLVPVLITGQQVMVLPIAIFSYTSYLLNWTLASAISLILLVIVAGITFSLTILANRYTRRGEWEIV